MTKIRYVLWQDKHITVISQPELLVFSPTSLVEILDAEDDVKHVKPSPFREHTATKPSAHPL